MSKEAVHYVRNMLQLGYDVDSISEELEKKGWSKKHIKEILYTVRNTRIGPISLTVYDKAFILLGFIGLLIMIVWVSSGTKAPTATVAISFLPTLLSLLSVFIILRQIGKQYLVFMYLVPLCWCGLLFGLYSSGAALSNADINNILLLNLFLSVGVITILHIINTDMAVMK